MTQKGEKIIFRADRARMIAKNLPDDWFGRAVFEKAIRATGIESRQSVDSHVAEMLAFGWINQPRPGKFQLTNLATETGDIRVRVFPAIRIPEVKALIEKALAGLDQVSVEEVS